MTDPYQQQPYPGQDPTGHPSGPVPAPGYPSTPGYGQPPVPYGAPMYGAPYAAQYATPLKTSGLAVAGMVVGIVALIFFWVPFFDVVAAITAIGLSWAGMVQAGKPGWTGQGMGIAGLVCGILAAIPAVIFLIWFFVSLSAVGATCAFYC
ncbi:DUF4190 domain-containing protein [Amycolatopsis sp. AA4]|uniref:DUF4190 domain-containing protein n=1 Tax=Actinomycetes TaxID=1760 RepID=UPI0001B54BDB|nr:MULTISPECIES: DUF4190 domain-containing protein [Actinomycetes]ATY14989.1 DUF4190 domain-containing protein [Amycolatopsis sp. AA4]EFL11182.1 predicted protein [Streptomyces sp. AA4]